MNEINGNKEAEALKCIRDLALSLGRIPSVRELMRSMEYRSPRSASLIFQKLINKGFLKKKNDGTIQMTSASFSNNNESTQTVDVPLLGRIACGSPIFAEQNIEGYFSVSIKLARPPHRYFLLKARGDSMNLREIKDGDLLLIKQQDNAKKGDIVVALIDDESTVKEFLPFRNGVALMPRSNNRKYKPIILTKDFRIQGVVASRLPDFRNN